MAPAPPQQKPAAPPPSKRQRRAQGPNPANTWQQQPRIKSAGARARAYVAYAGLADAGDGAPAPASSSADGAGGRRAVDLLLDPRLDPQSPEIKFGRLLGGTDQRARHGAVRMLREYLRARSDIASGMGLSELDLLKLWKGLWYTLYMADKAPVQDKLAKILAELMWCLAGTDEEDEYAGQVYCQMTDDGADGATEAAGVASLSDGEDGDVGEGVATESASEDESHDPEGEDEDAALEETSAGGDEEDAAQRIHDLNQKHCRGAHLVSLFLSTFLRTVRREWGHVDKHRVDKFYTAVRYMVSEAYKYMSKRHWNIGIVRLFNDVLYEEGLAAETPGLTNGLRYHLIDICVDELAKVNRGAARPLTEATFLDCLEPFFGLAQRAEDKHVQKRVLDNVLTKFLHEYSFVCPLALAEVDDAEAEAEEEEGSAKALIFDQVHVGTVSKFIFQIASDANTDARFRKSLYEMHKTFVRQTREAGRDVDLDQYLGAGEGDAELPDEGAAPSAFEETAAEAQDADATMAEKEDGPEAAKIASPTQTQAEIQESDDNSSGVTNSEQAPEKKKKRKKKKSKGEKESAKVVEKAAAEEGESTKATSNTKSSQKQKKKEDAKLAEKSAADEGDSTMAIPATKSSLKKKRKEDAKLAEKAAAAAAAAAAADEGDSTMATPKTKSSLKKKRKEDVKLAEIAAADEGDANMARPKSKASSKKKRKKQDNETEHESTNSKKQTSPPAVDPRSMRSPERGVPADAEATLTASAFKRVSFGSMNHCKSHKASMKAVKTLEKKRWDTQSRTPEKGILRPMGNKSTEKKARPSSGPASRKKRGRKQT